MDNCPILGILTNLTALIFPCFTGACLALAEMSFGYSLTISSEKCQNWKEVITYTHIPLAELLGIKKSRKNHGFLLFLEVRSLQNLEVLR